MEIQEENLQSGFPELKLLKQVSRVLQKEKVEEGRPLQSRFMEFGYCDG